MKILLHSDVAEHDDMKSVVQSPRVKSVVVKKGIVAKCW